MFFDGIILANLNLKRNIARFFRQNGSKPGSVHRLRFCVLLFPAKNERKDLKSYDFRSFMVAAAGLEPAASGL